MSVFGKKADITRQPRHVAFILNLDMLAPLPYRQMRLSDSAGDYLFLLSVCRVCTDSYHYGFWCKPNTLDSNLASEVG